MKNIERPAPVGTDANGQPVFDHEEVALYREARGVDQVRLAGAMGVSQPLIAQYETGRKELTPTMAARIITAVDRIADRREARASQGEARLNLMRLHCRANVGKGGRLERCGRVAMPGLVVCAAHFEQHENLVASFTDDWVRRMVRSSKRKGVTR